MKNRILQLEEFVASLPQKIENMGIEFIQYVYTTIDKLKDLSQTNYQLGLFHMDKGNVSDAKMRFVFVTKLAPEFALAHYHLARCHLFNIDFEKARQELNIALSLDNDLVVAKYRLGVANKDIKFQSIPIQVIQEDYNNCSHDYERYLEVQQKYKAPEILSKAIAKYFADSEMETEDMSALDLGCGTGLVGIYLKQIVAIKSLVGVDIARNMLALAKELEINNDSVYDQVEECDFNSLKVTKKKYNIVTACMSFVYDSDLSKAFTKLASIVAKDAVLGLVILKSDGPDAVFDYDNGCFAFGEKYLSNVFKKFKWRVVSQEERKIFASGAVGLVFVLSK